MITLFLLLPKCSFDNCTECILCMLHGTAVVYSYLVMLGLHCVVRNFPYVYAIFCSMSHDMLCFQILEYM